VPAQFPLSRAVGALALVKGVVVYYRQTMELEIGHVLGSYRVVRALGEGGMARVYEVEHVTLGVHYALKTFTLDSGRVEFFRKRFLAEGRLLARMSHPNLVRVFDLAYDDATGLLYYVMDLVLYKDGEAHTLSDIEEGSVEESVLAQWFSELCDALDYIHSLGVVHRDIKLNNILLRPDGRVVLSDFGISRITGERLRSDIDVSRTMVASDASTGCVVMGTEGFIAPEVAAGAEATQAADVYSLGVVFFKLLTCVWYDPCLAPSNDAETTTSINSVKLLSHLDYNWCEILPQMLDVDPAKRPTDLLSLAGQLHVRPHDVEQPNHMVRWLVAAGLAAAIAAAVLFFALFRTGSEAGHEVAAHDAALRSGSDKVADDLDDAFAAPEGFR